MYGLIVRPYPMIAHCFGPCKILVDATLEEVTLLVEVGKQEETTGIEKGRGEMLASVYTIFFFLN